MDQINEEKLKEEAVGSYKLTDAANYKWNILLNSDGTARLCHNDDETIYAYWEINCFEYVPEINLSYGELELKFPGGKMQPFTPILADGYLYYNSSAYKSKDPRKRLPLTKE